MNKIEWEEKPDKDGILWGIQTITLKIPIKVFKATNNSFPGGINIDYAIERWKEYILAKRGSRKQREEALEEYVKCVLAQMVGVIEVPTEIK